GASRAGAGLVTLFVHPDALSRLSALPASVMVRPLAPAAALAAATTFDAVAVGPGLGGGRPLAADVLDALADLLHRDQPAVLDADALVPGLPAGRHAIRTPHPGELARLLACTVAEVQADRFGRVRENPGVTLLKGPHTLIHDGAGHVHVNPTGSPALATAGSGDVLTGVVGALLARGLSPVDAGRLGAWVHGRAGEILLDRAPDGHIAPDIAGALPLAIAELLDVPRRP
ncbi:MAG: NAD(P)H-hydrate dehydratase, partial [Myxococcales bacterium]|nr:NAD(P)H-hydrate dehydratase [Myxococcales bacterium]